MFIVSLVQFHSPVVLMLLITLIQSIGTKACAPQLLPIPRPKSDERGDFSFKSYQSKRSKTLDCTCGSPRNASINFPWDVLITHYYSSSSTSSPDKVCRGTVINDRVILTSSSCLLKLSVAEILDKPWKVLFPQSCYVQPSQVKVWVNTGGTAGKQNIMEVSDIYTNPLFLFGRAIYNKVDYDIALLTVKTPLNFAEGTSLPVCLPTFPYQITDSSLAGLETILTRWYLTRPQNSLITSTQDYNFTTFSSIIYPRMRCRLNTENVKWISDRFLCTLAPPLLAKSTDIGAALLTANENQYTQIGVHSWRTEFPLLHKLSGISLASSVLGFMETIEDYSAKANAQWCTKDWNGLVEKRLSVQNLNNNMQVDQNQEFRNTLTSEVRNIRKGCRCGVINSLANGRIQGGQDARPYEYGWQTLIVSTFENGKRQVCGGSIINSRVVITAAHCVYRNVAEDGPNHLVKPGNIKVHIHRYQGPLERDDQSRTFQVAAVIPHPNFTTTDVVENDIALIILRKPLCFTCLRGKVSPICFPETNEAILLDGRTDAKVIGWGRTNVLDKKSHAEKLQELSISIISRTDCFNLLQTISDKSFAKQVWGDSKKICAGTFSSALMYKDPGQGDSGGPLFLPVSVGSQTLVHVGVASMITMGPSAVADRDPVTVTFYTKTQEYVDFVDYYSFLVDAVWCSR